MSENILTNSDHVLRAALKARQAVMLVGEPGTSKTASVAQLAEDLGKTLITIVPSRMDSQDISGFPTKGEYTYGEITAPVTEYAPQRWQMEIMEKKEVILLLDEFSNAHPSTRASLLSFIQDRQFPNGDFFPDETVIVCAMNPTDSAADGYELDPATTNRMTFLSWKPSVDSWLKGMVDNWGKGVESESEKKWRNLIVRFINDEPGALHTGPNSNYNGEAYGVSDNSSDRAVLQYAWASRRSWDNLSRILGALETNDSMIEDTIMEGTVGYASASKFRDWLRKNGALDIANIIKNPRKFSGWDTLSFDDTNLILRSALENVDDSTPVKKVMNIIDIFRIIVEIDKGSAAAPYLQDLAKVRNRAGGLNSDEKKQVTEELKAVIPLFNEISKRRK